MEFLKQVPFARLEAWPVRVVLMVCKNQDNQMCLNSCEWVVIKIYPWTIPIITHAHILYDIKPALQAQDMLTDKGTKKPTRGRNAPSAIAKRQKLEQAHFFGRRFSLYEVFKREFE